MANSLLSLFVMLVLSGFSQAATLADPTRPANYLSRAVIQEELPDEVVDWRLTAIRVSGDSRTAVINNKLVKAGDSIGQALVLEIKPLSVVLNYEQQNIQVNLIQHEVEKTFSVKNRADD